MKIVILANGEFPKADKSLSILNSADKIICCDGAVENLLNYGLEPSLIIGDLDSVSENIKNKYQNIIYHISEQNTNDLTKAVNWCVANKYLEFDILGATGKREDHTIGNISLLSKYVKIAKSRIISDYGIFTPINKSTNFNSFKGQQVSIFAMDSGIEISSEGLKYQLKNMQLENWWNGTLNESINNSFSISFSDGILIIYQLF